jgi:uncharacterized membrane protein
MQKKPFVNKTKTNKQNQKQKPKTKRKQRYLYSKVFRLFVVVSEPIYWFDMT